MIEKVKNYGFWILSSNWWDKVRYLLSPVLKHFVFFMAAVVMAFLLLLRILARFILQKSVMLSLLLVLFVESSGMHISFQL